RIGAGWGMGTSGRARTRRSFGCDGGGGRVCCAATRFRTGRGPRAAEPARPAHFVQSKAWSVLKLKKTLGSPIESVFGLEPSAWTVTRSRPEKAATELPSGDQVGIFSSSFVDVSCFKPLPSRLSV